ncbi:MAG: ATP-binding cassette domain-containing protein [Erysipelotrichaceae bacterium]
MLEINNLSIMVNQRFLVKNLSLSLNKNDKLAIIGEEGNGKSSLLKVLAGCFDYGSVEGNINYKGNTIGYLPQSISDEDLAKTVNDYLFNADDIYQNTTMYYRYCAQLNISSDLLPLKMGDLSGGQKIKLALLKLLLEDRDILLLDEPTNDLDLKSLQWLEDFINSVDKPIMFVSHDETLLENTANKILHLQQIKKKSDCQHSYEVTGYLDYVNERIKKINKQNQLAVSEKRQFEKQQQKLSQITNKVEYGLRTVSRGDPHTAQLLKKKMKNLKAQQRKMDEKELTHKADVEESINFIFTQVDIPANKIILDLHIDELTIADHKLAENIELLVKGNRHICIIGENGIGKTTLLKEINQILSKRKDLKSGYMSQNYDDVLSDYKLVTDYLASSGKKQDITQARLYLGNMKFTGDESNGLISDLSNGSKAKLILTKLVIDKCDVLLLDEPTRNVSPLSNPVIRKVLRQFNGTIISVSHDRKFIDEVIDDVYLLTYDGIKQIEKEEIWKKH